MLRVRNDCWIVSVTLGRVKRTRVVAMPQRVRHIALNRPPALDYAASSAGHRAPGIKTGGRVNLSPTRR